jgi:hypothetical protein
LKRAVFRIALTGVLISGTVVAVASPAAASYPCNNGYSCYYDTDPYNFSAEWRAPSCGDHDLRPIGWRDRISYVANRGGGNARMWNEYWLGWYEMDVVPLNTQRSYIGSGINNETDRIIVDC